MLRAYLRVKVCDEMGPVDEYSKGLFKLVTNKFIVANAANIRNQRGNNENPYDGAYETWFNIHNMDKAYEKCVYDFNKYIETYAELFKHEEELLPVGFNYSISVECILFDHDTKVGLYNTLYTSLLTPGIKQEINNVSDDSSLFKRKEWLKVAIIDLPQESMIKQDIQDFLDIWDRDDRDEVVDD